MYYASGIALVKGIRLRPIFHRTLIFDGYEFVICRMSIRICKLYESLKKIVN